MKTYKAIICWNSGETTVTTAKKEKTGWLVGGENAKETFRMGGKISIIIDNKMYRLQGCFLVFQDNVCPERSLYLSL